MHKFTKYNIFYQSIWGMTQKSSAGMPGATPQVKYFVQTGNDWYSNEPGKLIELISIISWTVGLVCCRLRFLNFLPKLFSDRVAVIFQSITRTVFKYSTNQTRFNMPSCLQLNYFLEVLTFWKRFVYLSNFFEGKISQT